MKTRKVLTICSVLFLLALFAGQASAAKYGHNFDAGPVALDAIDAGGTTLDCNNCHLQSHADTGAVQFVPTGDIVYDRCFQCHSATGGAANTVIGNHTSIKYIILKAGRSPRLTIIPTQHHWPASHRTILNISVRI